MPFGNHTHAGAAARARRRPATSTSLLNAVRCRRGRALYAARAHKIWLVTPDSYRVPSETGHGIYRVSLTPGAEHCTCPDFERFGHHHERRPGSFFCKHLYAALLWRIKREGVAIARRARSAQLEKAS